MRYITKFNYERSKGFQVRVPNIKNNKIIPYSWNNNNAFFAKGKGTWEGARKKAVRWRNEYLRSKSALHLLTTKNRQRPYENSSKNTSGVIGIAYATTYRKEYVYYSYIATWTQNGVNFKRSFSIQHYGRELAFQKACKLRFQHSGTLIVTDMRAIPCLPTVDYIVQKQ